MTRLRDWIHPSREGRGTTAAALSGIADAQLALTIEDQGEVRAALLRIATLMHQRRVELAQTFDALGWRQTEAQRILSLAMEARGQLRSILVGLGDDALDVAPAPGEWSVREALAHLRTIDDRYMQSIVYAVWRMHSGVELPIRRPDTGDPAEPPDLSGGLARVLNHLDGMRDVVLVNLAPISEADLTAPVMARDRQIPVRQRLHLFAAHEREHAGQIARTLRAIGFAQTEAQMILGAVEAARGVVEGMLIGLPEDLFLRAPAGDLPAVRDILTTALHEEERLVDTITQAIA